jgi:hypothetical protein
MGVSSGPNGDVITFNLATLGVPKDSWSRVESSIKEISSVTECDISHNGNTKVYTRGDGHQIKAQVDHVVSRWTPAPTGIRKGQKPKYVNRAR